MRYFKNKLETNTFAISNFNVEYDLTDWQEITEQEYNAIVNLPLTQEQIEQQHLNELRAKREPLLKAFDIYKSNVAYGVITENYELHQQIIEWYSSILNLEEMALNEVPKVIKQYVVGGSE